MLSRTIHGDELERLIAAGHELMLRASGHDDDVAGVDFLVFACDGGEAAAGCEE